MTKLSNKGKDLFTVYIVYLISTYVAFQSGMIETREASLRMSVR